jgi:NADH:ubiquinone oxidoreductase subunit K
MCVIPQNLETMSLMYKAIEHEVIGASCYFMKIALAGHFLICFVVTMAMCDTCINLRCLLQNCIIN